ncbi:hypothetical protein Bbelb_379160 [Branchiostoma belcheri]|nr:hypothetical protein Bbelb_379160 [Branchiostoma belcheri]
MDGGLIQLKPQHNVTAKEGKNANLTWQFAVPAEIDVTNMNDMAVWAEDRTSYCELMSENGIYHKFCYGDFVGRAEVAVTWFPKLEDGHRTRKGQLKLVLTNVTRDDSGWYEGEIKLHGRDIRNGKIFLHVTGRELPRALYWGFYCIPSMRIDYTVSLIVVLLLSQCPQVVAVTVSLQASELVSVLAFCQELVWSF